MNSIIFLFSLNLLNNMLLKLSVIIYFTNYSYGPVIFLSGLFFGIPLYYLYNKKNRLNIFYININLFNKYFVYLFLFIIMLYFIDYYLYPINDIFLNRIYLDGNDPKEFTVNNIKFDISKIIKDGFATIGGAAVFKAGIDASAGVLKTTALPPTLKLAFIGVGGAGSYFIFRGSQSVYEAISSRGLSDADKKSVNITITENKDGSFTGEKNNPECPLEDELYLSKLIDVLQNSFNLYICIFILINLCIIFIVLKSLSDLNYNLD